MKYLSEMKSTPKFETVISNRWSRLKKKALDESDPDKLIVILEEVNDLLFTLEMRINAHCEKSDSRVNARSRTIQCPDCQMLFSLLPQDETFVLGAGDKSTLREELERHVQQSHVDLPDEWES
jgi:hypothetical protein